MGLQIGKALPMATVLRHIWLSAHQVFAKRSHTHRDNPLPSKMTQLGLAITEVAVNNGGVFWLRNIGSQNRETKKHKNLVFLFCFKLIVCEAPAESSPPRIMCNIITLVSFWRCADLAVSKSCVQIPKGVCSREGLVLPAECLPQ